MQAGALKVATRCFARVAEDGRQTPQGQQAPPRLLVIISSCSGPCALRVPTPPDAGVTALPADFPLGLGRNGQMTARQH